jgi:hypothetical protein
MEFYSTFIASSSEERQAQSFRLFKRYPDKIPVIIDRANRRDPKIGKNKFLVPSSSTCAELLFMLRRHIELEPSQSIFLFHDKSLVNSSMSIQQLRHLSNLQNNDGFTYLFYSVENTFG